MSSASSRSNRDPVDHALARATAVVRDAVAATAASNPVVLIDGRSGAGKSSLARRLVRDWPMRGRVQSIALDAIYPGWDGLREGVDLARTEILVPHARGIIGVWRSWDWDRDGWDAAHAVDPSLPLIVEGAGLLTRATATLGDVRVWLESPTTSRRRRALDRDGETYRPHWDRWAAQEERHIAEDEPAAHATHVLPVP
ncbi:hypothetical protein [Microbacterium xanthum]|uniref:hypothetical protein n=1 Tax=Microbacterium xanthum TaxID=3079794 RepID=UPI002AD2D9B8|nr:MULTISPECIES: hypothetical protein [unclassified Microbacterium]MDZ8172365.1 hypothetical protein [Microbacterium sp. KSW-48]MDZ8201917.1 hypothetical protein [Microbacterium sp. SSW1-59]